MAKYEQAVWPQDKYRFALYDNAQGLQTTKAVLAANPGAVGAINLWYFAMVASPGVKAWDHQNGGVMLDGKWTYEQYDYPGLCIDKDGYASVGYKADATWSYTACVQADYINNQHTNTKVWPRNGVTYTGLRADGAVVGLVASKDTGLTSGEAVTILREAGCVTILRWDGSWSSQGQLLPGQVVKPSQHRAVRGWLIIYPRNHDNKEDKPVDGIQLGMMTKSDCYKAGRTITPKGIMAHSTATPGIMAQALRDKWDAPGVITAVHAFVDNQGSIQALPWNRRGWHAGNGTSGKSANDTHISFEICEPAECRLLPIEWVPLKRGGIGELQQTTVSALKEAAEDGKLTEAQIAILKSRLLQDTKKKLSAPVVQLLEASKMDITALIQGAAEDLIYNMRPIEPYFPAVVGGLL